jgi:DNA-binding transcriptional regulator YdaS (Cro superfamily)
MDTSQAIKKVIASVGSQAETARRVGVKPATLAEWAMPNCHPKHRPVPPKRAHLLVALEPSVRLWHLLPDDWHEHWPHLIGTPGAPKVKAKAA